MASGEAADTLEGAAAASAVAGAGAGETAGAGLAGGAGLSASAGGDSCGRCGAWTHAIRARSAKPRSP
ncbi:MAG: hypothetical protein AUH10_09810 [Gammaproteobacteria bacterium 13_2_20CM_66_19]|nr:MAG: hypothetical protein AUH10_09810 [Gammaproteobacteria bacterium 13_2_20CM_66_19]